MGGTIECVCHDFPVVDHHGVGWHIKVPDPSPCDHKRSMVQVFNPNLDLPWIYGDHGCTSNEIASLVKRHLTDTKPTSVSVLEQGWELLQPLIRHCKGVEKLSSSELIDSRPPRMKKRYRKALSLDLKPVHGTVNLFIKFEKKEDPTKAPRAIQYRATPYTARLAKYIIAIEKQLYKVVDGVNHGFPIIAKGLNALQRGEIISKAFGFYAKPTVYLIDHSKFDSCVNIDLLRLEHRFYKSVFPDKFLSYLLKQQERNFGRSRNGLIYRNLGRRMSGDANTASGNCILNYMLLRLKFGPRAIIFLDGDDSVVFMPEEIAVDFSDTGMDSKINVVYDLEDIEFCQSKPVKTTTGYVMCREPLRALSRSLYKLGKMPSNWRDYLYTVGVGEGLCSPEMPIIQDLARKFRSYEGDYQWYFSEYRPNTLNCKIGYREPTTTSKVGFAMAFDVDVHQQRLIGSEIEQMVLNKRFN